MYEFKRECLAEFERLSEQKAIDVFYGDLFYGDLFYGDLFYGDLFYGDESGVSLLPCVPYAWQFADEQILMPSERGGAVKRTWRGGEANVAGR